MLTHKNSFLLRPLWLASPIQINISESLSIFFPENLSHADSTQYDHFCAKIIELGYNAVVFADQRQGIKTQKGISSPKLDALGKCFRRHGIQWFVKPQIRCHDLPKCPLNPAYKSLIQESIKSVHENCPEIGGIFWESSLNEEDYFAHPSAKYSLQSDLVQEELRWVEEAFKGTKSLIFFIPCPHIEAARRHSRWLSQLHENAAKNSIIAFSAVAGSPFDDHLPPHCFWQHLSLPSAPSVMSMMPIVNCGGINQGEGLWPSLVFDQFEGYFSRVRRHGFAGVLTLAGHVPPGRGFLDCNLWVGGQLQAKESSLELLLEEWFRAHKQPIDYHYHRELFRKIRSIVLELSFLRSLVKEKRRDILSLEEAKIYADSLVAQLKHLSLLVLKLEKPKKTSVPVPALSDYFDYFVRDARRIVAYFAQHFNISSSLQLSEDNQASFWTQTGTGLKYAAKIQLLDHPLQGEPGTLMEYIFKENRHLA